MVLNCGIYGPWLVCGNFNNPLNPEDRVGSTVSWSKIKGFRHCLDMCGLLDIKSSGCYFTWNNKQDGELRVMCKLDRMLGNYAWMDKFCDYVAQFCPEGLFDHSPVILVSSHDIGVKKKSFRYFNMWSFAEDFLDIIKVNWSIPISSVPMFQIVYKLRRLKGLLKTLNKEKFGDIGNADHVAYQNLLECQKKLQEHLDDLINATN